MNQIISGALEGVTIVATDRGVQYRTIEDLPAYPNADEVAIYFGVPVGTVRQWTLTGYIPSVKIGKHRRYPREQIRGWELEMMTLN